MIGLAMNSGTLPPSFTQDFRFSMSDREGSPFTKFVNRLAMIL